MIGAASASFQGGRLAECRERLSRVQVRGFSRLQWYIDCNLLACRMQAQLRSGEGLQDVLCSYERLWRKMRGVSPSPESVCVELCVVLGVCQLLVLLSRWSLVLPHISTVLERAAAVLSPDSLTLSSLSSVLASVEDAGAQVMVRCVRKMQVLQAVVETGEDGDGVAEVIALHSRWLGGDQSETIYRQAWLQYSSGEYQSALTTLSSSPPLFSPSSPLSPLCHLLCGACYARQAQPQLALLHWKKSMETISSPHQLLPALQNCALVYGEDHTAAMATRKLEIEALKGLRKCNQIMLPLWVWLDDKVGGATAHLSHRSLVEAAYRLACQEMKGQRYELASEALEECISAVENGASVQSPSPLPLPSTLHLLRAHCAVCSGQDVRRGRGLCEELIDSSPLSVSPLWRSEVMCILATACLYLGECVESRQWSLRCLEGLEMAVRTATKPDTQNHLLLVQQHIQHLLALGAIAHAQWREGLQLLSCLLATPTGLYNHSLLQCRVGVVMGGATGWLEGRGKLPTGKEEAKQQLRVARESLDQKSGRDKDFVAMDTAMLSLWIQHNTQHKK